MHLQKRRDIFRVETTQGQLERCGKSRVDLEDAIDLVGPSEFVGGQAPAEAACRTETLRFGEKRLIAPQLFLRPSAFRDVAQIASEGRRLVERDTRDCELDREFAPVGAYCGRLDASPEHLPLPGGQVVGQAPPVLLPE